MGVFACSVLGLALVLRGAGAEASPPAKRPHVTRVHVVKSAHTMELFDGNDVLATYKVAIGPGGAGNKHMEGDKITPVGRYHVVRRGPSQFRVFMLLDYPNAEDRARFARMKQAGELPKNATIGGDVGIHGSPAQPEWKPIHKDYDWTLGCIAVDDDEIEQIARTVADGTVVDIDD